VFCTKDARSSAFTNALYVFSFSFSGFFIDCMIASLSFSHSLQDMLEGAPNSLELYLDIGLNSFIESGFMVELDVGIFISSIVFFNSSISFSLPSR